MKSYFQDIKETLLIYFRIFLRRLFSSETDVRSDAYRVVVIFAALIGVGMTVAFLTGQARGLMGAFYWTIRILFEDFDSLQEFSGWLYVVGFGLKFAAFIIIPVFTAIIAAKVLAASFFNPRTSHLEGHIVLCGNMANFERFAREVFGAGHRDLVLISQVTSLSEDFLQGRLILLKESEDIAADLTKANLAEASQLVIASEPGESPSQFESRAVMTVLSARNINREIYITVESPSLESREFFLNAGVGEVVTPDDLISSILSLVVVNDRLTPFFQEINSIQEGNSLHIEDLPSGFAGLPFAEALAGLKEKNNWILLAVKRGERIHTNPHRFTMEKGDRLLVIREG